MARHESRGRIPARSLLPLALILPALIVACAVSKVHGAHVGTQERTNNTANISPLNKESAAHSYLNHTVIRRDEKREKAKDKTSVLKKVKSVLLGKGKKVVLPPQNTPTPTPLPTKDPNRKTSRLFSRFDLDGDDLLNEREVAALLMQLKAKANLKSSSSSSGMGSGSYQAQGSSSGGSGSASSASSREKGTHDVSLDGETLSVGDSEFELLFRQLSNLKHTRDPSKDPRMSLQEDITFVKDFMYMLTAATVGGVLVSYVKLPSLIGFLLGGMMIGPGGLNIITELVEMETLASLGIAFVLFHLGLEFSITDLLTMKRLALLGGLFSAFLVILLSAVMTPLLSLTDNIREAIVVGLAIWLSSTAVVLQCISGTGGNGGGHNRNQSNSGVLQYTPTGESTATPRAFHSQQQPGSSNKPRSGLSSPSRALSSNLSSEIPEDSLTTNDDTFSRSPLDDDIPEDQGIDSDRSRKSMLALLIFQDVAIGIIVAILPALKGSVSSFADQVLGSFLRLCLFIVISLLIAEFVLPYYLEALERTRSSILFTLGSLVYCLMFAYLSEHLGLAIELGAFTAGLSLSESKYRDHVESSIRNIKDSFASVFFVSIGLMIHWKYFYFNFFRVFLMLIFILCSKTVAMGLSVYLFGGGTPSPNNPSSKTSWASSFMGWSTVPFNVALACGITLSQAGEFTFVIASKAQALQMFSGADLRVLNGATALSMLLTPFLVRFARMLAKKPHA